MSFSSNNLNWCTHVARAREREKEDEDRRKKKKQKKKHRFVGWGRERVCGVRGGIEKVGGEHPSRYSCCSHGSTEVSLY